jgi:hypothetical protein
VLGQVGFSSSSKETLASPSPRGGELKAAALKKRADRTQLAGVAWLSPRWRLFRFGSFMAWRCSTLRFAFRLSASSFGERYKSRKEGPKGGTDKSKERRGEISDELII